MDARIAARLRVVRIIWMAIFVATVLYVLVLAFVVRSPAQAPPLVALAVPAAIVAVMSVVIPRKLLGDSLRTLNVTVTNEAGEPIGSFRESAPMRKVIADPAQAIVDAFPRYHTTLLMGLALAESVALFGLAAGYMGAPPAVSAPFFAVSFALLATKFPRAETIARALERKTGAACDLSRPT